MFVVKKATKEQVEKATEMARKGAKKAVECEGKVLSPLEKQLRNHPLRRSYRDIAEDCFYPEDLKFGKEQFEQLSTTKEWIRIEWVLEVIHSQQLPETKELLAHWKKRRKHNRSGHYCDFCDDEVWLVNFGIKFEAFLRKVARKEAELQQHIKDFPSLTELHASFPNENLLVWRAKVVMWKKRLEALQGGVNSG